MEPIFFAWLVRASFLLSLGLRLMKPAPNENRGVCNNSNGSSIRLAAFSTAKYVPCALLDTSSTLVLKRSMGKLISGW
ncbi:hypothetical protein TNIN_141411 [Trichonephila inaurata madagascariensis]|uniref:Secreted protein n=1 Tax=Trichonephila inaurata madagascariensis TaxID=2747483 RepID=A0A8X6I2R4_9ARAC|nr:hypothetical protein TNIN_141411 [Trichonephila inaurata madagascariensis]